MKTVMADRRWIKDHADLGTGPVSTETCTSADFFERERDGIFRQLWLNMGREEELAEPGDYIVRDLAVANTSVLIVRGKDRKIRAFHNVCMHRGNRLVNGASGTCNKLLVCRFHSWAYDLQGQLQWVSDEANFYDIDKSNLGLRSIAVDTWEGFIFINLSSSPAQSLREYLGGLVQQIGGYPFQQHSLLCRYRIEEQANWKVILDAQNEVYHLPFLHIAYPDFCPLNEQKFSRIQSFKRFDRHTVYSVENNAEHQMTATEAIAARTFPGDGTLSPSMIGWFDFYTIFPNFCLIFLGGNYLTYNIWPVSVSSSVWEVSVYQPATDKPSERFAEEYARCRLRDLLQEDASNHEAIQASLNSGALAHFQLQDEEIQIRHFHKMVREHAEARGQSVLAAAGK
ncbi:MAG: aromatic ring-hydroxylating dioxygenase subunit alpha [Candidatus Binataceae bacterium]|nr:aromatic ring-hydroxylating dioxygenase subunit alpha [Candidatus Binataceae bacterium]